MFWMLRPFYENSFQQTIKRGGMQTFKFFHKPFVKNAKTFNCISLLGLILTTTFDEDFVIKFEVWNV